MIEYITIKFEPIVFDNFQNRKMTIIMSVNGRKYESIRAIEVNNDFLSIFDVMWAKIKIIMLDQFKAEMLEDPNEE